MQTGHGHDAALRMITKYLPFLDCVHCHICLAITHHGDFCDEPGSGGPGGGLSGDGFGGLHIQTAIGAPSPLSLGGPSPSLHSHSPSLHAHSPSPQPPSPSEEWRRWAETEVNKERRHVDKLVGVIRTLVEYVNPGSAGSGKGSGKGGESADEGKFSYAFYVFAANKLV